MILVDMAELEALLSVVEILLTSVSSIPNAESTGLLVDPGTHDNI